VEAFWLASCELNPLCSPHCSALIMKELVCDYLAKEVTVNGRKLNVSSRVPISIQEKEMVYVHKFTEFLVLAFAFHGLSNIFVTS